MRRSPSLLLALTTLGAVALEARGALAQDTPGDINTPAPNVLLLVDTSGSMEYMTAFSDCPDPTQPCLPRCYPDEPNPDLHGRSRWTELVEVLTGRIQSYSCFSHDRSRMDFREEFTLGTELPYDLDYIFPYHRPQSSLCTPGPGELPPAGSPYEFPPDGIRFRPFSTGLNALDYATTCSNFEQASDGLLDAFKGRIRFGLMTFDTRPDPGTGLSGTMADHKSGVDGTWSYFLDNPWCSASTPYCSGRPAGCEIDLPQEVGARNAAAPPWEGRMVAFGPPHATESEMNARNEWIQKILLATRPYGATPIAGLLHDARNFFWHDTSDDPLNPEHKFGPAGDPLVAAGQGCRANFAILLSDGEPNLDLRPWCEQGDGVCPFELPWDVTDDLITQGDPARRVRTFVIGIAVGLIDPEGTGTPINCEELPDDICTDYPDNREVQACCTLNRIAYHGAPPEERGQPEALDHALYANNAEELRAALSTVFSKTLSRTTGRTRPVFASVGIAGGAFEFRSGVEVRAFSLWKGQLQRVRFECDPQTNEPVQQDIDPAQGDDFIRNVESELGGRTFTTVIGATDGNSIHSERTMRPHLTGATDGLSEYTGEQTNAELTSSFPSTVPPAAMNVDASSCSDLDDPILCKNRYLNWLLGLDNGTDFHRCPNPQNPAECSAIGDIFHSTPKVVPPPSELLVDESYSTFAVQQAQRDTVLYVSTNDGFLHAFRVLPGRPEDPPVESLQNNELWAFAPPAVLPSIPSMYPGTRLPLLDGEPMIKDVVATPSSDGGSYPFVLERRRADAQEGGGEWRTILVQGFGGLRGGYFALDVTEPRIEQGNEDTTGPKFLWQITTDEDGNPFFGSASGTPLITTIAMEMQDGSNEVREVAVAILPGGNGGSPTDEACPAHNDDGFIRSRTQGFETPRAEISCYDPAAVEAMSLTIVRLDTGQIIRTFRHHTSDLIEALTGVVFGNPDLIIGSPMVGKPAAFPAITGAVADRVFLGDRDGRIWRLDLSSANPANWELKVFFDAYTGLTDNSKAQPIVTPPVLSVNDRGDLTLNFSTGDQEVLTQTPGIQNYVYSLTEAIDESGQLVNDVNWRETFDDGVRVTGPLTLFDRSLFFTTFTPAAGSGCEVGESAVWGLHYVEPEADEIVDSGGRPALPNPNNPDELVKSHTPSEGVIFGVAVTQRPTCTTLDDNPGDPFLGFGSTVTATNTNPGKFMLVMQVGGSQDGAGGGIHTESVELPAPRSNVRVTSWAPIIE